MTKKNPDQPGPEDSMKVSNARKKSTTGTGQDQGAVGQTRHDLSGWIHDGEHDVDQYVDTEVKGPPGSPSVAENMFGSKSKAKPKDKGNGKKSSSSSDTLTQGQIEQEIEQNPWNQLGQQLVSQLQAEQAPVTQALSGQLTQPATASAEQQALAATGVSPTSSASQWLQGEISQGNANDAPLQQAMAAYGQAYTQGQQGVDTALANLGTANALGVQTAPEQTWLTDLASHVQSNLAYYGQIPTSAAQNLPPALLYYLQQSGTGGAGGSGVEQLSGISVPGEKTPSSGIPSAVGPATGSGSSALNPGTGAAPS